MRICEKHPTSDRYADGRCKQCKSERAKEWRLKNPDKVKEREAKWRKENPDKDKERKAKWRKENPDKDNERKARWRKENPDKNREWNAKWRKENSERLRMYIHNLRGLPEPTRPDPGKCECCGGTNKNGHTLALDHDHITGTFRGWLCHRCNLGIGKLGDTLYGVTQAVKYLMRADSGAQG
jgi:hypothetical protein